jgi:hypothetical protein
MRTDTPQRPGTPVRREHPVEVARPSFRSLWGAWRALLRRPPWRTLFLLLLIVDLGFIAIQVATDITDYGFNGSHRLALETEGGIAQAYGWLQAVAGSAALFLVWLHLRRPSPGFWAAALAYLAVDDAVGLHEKLGSALARGLDVGEVGGLRAQDIGEVLSYVIVVSVAVVLLVLAERATPNRPSRLSLLMFPLAGLFAFFAGVLDTLDVFIALEDGGELIMLTLLALTAAMWAFAADDLARLTDHG